MEQKQSKIEQLENNLLGCQKNISKLIENNRQLKDIMRKTHQQINQLKNRTVNQELVGEIASLQLELERQRKIGEISEEIRVIPEEWEEVEVQDNMAEQKQSLD